MILKNTSLLKNTALAVFAFFAITANVFGQRPLVPQNLTVVATANGVIVNFEYIDSIDCDGSNTACPAVTQRMFVELYRESTTCPNQTCNTSFTNVADFSFDFTPTMNCGGADTTMAMLEIMDLCPGETYAIQLRNGSVGWMGTTADGSVVDCIGGDDVPWIDLGTFTPTDPMPVSTLGIDNNTLVTLTDPVCEGDSITVNFNSSAMRCAVFSPLSLEVIGGDEWDLLLTYSNSCGDTGVVSEVRSLPCDAMGYSIDQNLSFISSCGTCDYRVYTHWINLCLDDTVSTTPLTFTTTTACEVIIECPADSITDMCNVDVPPPATTFNTGPGGDPTLPTVTSGCGMITMTSSDDTTDVGCIRTITRSYFVVDTAMHRDTCEQIFQFKFDTIPAVITCPADTIIDCGVDTSAANLGMATATDNCDSEVTNITYSDVVTPGECPAEMTIERTWTAVDSCGNMAVTCIQTIMVQDTSAPVLACPADTSINCGVDTSVANLGMATATDNCDAAVTSITFLDVVTAGTCPAEMTIERTWTATDSCGNIATCLQTIMVQDTAAPVLTCPADTTINCGVDTSAANLGMATATDNCDAEVTNITYSDVVTPGTCPAEMTIERTWMAEDSCGNMAMTCIQTIMVQDTVAPILTCPSDTIIDCGGPTTDTQLGVATATDNCDAAVTNITFTDVITPGTCPAEMTIERTWMAEDSCGNMAISCVQMIMIQDTAAPILTCPSDTTVNCDSGTTPAETGMATATDNCDAAVTNITFSDVITPGSCPAAMTIERTWMAEDSCGNMAISCVQMIMVQDTVTPMYTCPADTTVDCGEDTSPMNLGMITATDNCDAEVTSISFNDVVTPGSCPMEMTIERTWTVSDSCGNSSTCLQTIMVQDTTPPVISFCPADTTVDCSSLTDTMTLGSIIAVDSCGGASGSGAMNVLVLATNSGANRANVQFGLGTLGVFATIDNMDANAGTPTLAQLQNYDAVLVWTNVPPTDPVGLGNVLADYVDDGGGLVVARFAHWQSTYDIEGRFNTDNYWALLPSTGDNRSVPLTLGTINEPASPLMAGVTSFNGGNSSFHSPGAPHPDASVVAEWSNGRPLILRRNINGVNRVDLNMFPPSSTVSGSFWDTSTDGWRMMANALNFVASGASVAPPESITFSDNVIPGSCPAEMTIERTFTATDSCGNTATCLQTIMVQDTTAPILVCPSDTTIDCGGLTTDTQLGVATATDNCDAVVTNISYTDVIIPGTCPAEMTIERTWMAEDSCGNMAMTCVQTITIQDTVAPMLSCPADTTINCESGTTPAATGMATATDNCDAAVTNITFTDVVIPDNGCVHAMMIERTWMAEDSCGNMAMSCVQTIMVQDTTPPVLTCPADTTVDCGIATNPMNVGMATATDNCDAVVTNITFTDIVTPGSCPAEMTIERTWMAEDSCGNMAMSCVQTIMVQDTMAPVISFCPADTTIDCGTPTDTMTLGSIMAVDSCGQSAMRVLIVSGGFDPTWDTEVAAGIMANSTFSVIDNMNGMLMTPTLADLQMYDAVLVYSDDAFMDPNTFGDNLADYIDAGGGVVVAVFANNSSLKIGGRFDTDNYWGVEPLGQSQGTILTLGTVHEPSSPLMNNVTTFNGGTSSYFGTGMVNVNATRVADWSNGSPLIVRREINGVQRVDLNFYPPSNLSRADFWVNTTDGWNMMVNALNFVGSSSAAEAPESITFADNVIPGSCANEMTIERTFMATDSCGNTATCLQTIMVQDTTPPVIGLCPADTTIDCATPTDTMTLGVPVVAANGAVFMRSQVGYPWGEGIRLQTEMDTVFGTGNWTEELYESAVAATIFSPVNAFVYMEGGDNNANAYNTFIQANIATIEAWVSAGGVLLMNAAPNQGGNINYGFGGVTLLYPSFSNNVQATNPAHPIWLGPHTPTSTSMTGGFYGHSILCPPGMNALIEEVGSGDDVLVEANFGAGLVIFGGMTTTNWHSPNAEAVNLKWNVLEYLAAASIDAGSCNESEITFVDNIIPGSCPAEMTIERTFTATDSCGNTATCLQTIMVQDTMVPTFTIPADTTIDCDTGISPAQTGFVDVTTDDCGGLIVTWDDVVTPGACIAEFTIERIWMVSDSCGNVAPNDTQMIVVQDTVGPTFTTPADTTIECGTPSSPAFTGFVTDSMDNCSLIDTVIFSDNVIPGNCPATFMIERLWSMEDECGNITTDMQIINVVDTVGPTFTIPADTTIDCGTDTSAMVLGDIMDVMDNCSAIVDTSFTSILTPGACPNQFTIERIWSVEDACGNITLDTQTIMVMDTFAPTIMDCPMDTTIDCNTDTSIIALGMPTAMDNCDAAVTDISYMDVITPGSCPSEMTIERTFTATDSCGNSATCLQTIMVQDTTDPVISFCPADTTVDCTSLTDTMTLGRPIADDNCGTGILNNAILYAPSEADDPTWRADIAAATGSTVDYFDARSATPTLAFLMDYDAVHVWVNFGFADAVAYGDVLADYVDAGGVVLIGKFATYSSGNFLQGRIMTVGYNPVFSPTGSGNFSADSYAADGVTPVFAGVGALTAPYHDNLALQGAGASDGTYTTSGELFAAWRPDYKVWYLNGMCSKTVPAGFNMTGNWETLVNNAVALGAGGRGPVESITFVDNVTPGACPSEMTIERTFTATDSCGNTATCLQTITVQDTVAPIITCPANITIECDESTDPMNTGNATATDNCDAAVTTFRFSDVITPGACPQEMTITRSWVAEDSCGNISDTCVQIIDVEDTTPPVITCVAPFLVGLDENGEYQLTPEELFATLTDNCSTNFTFGILPNDGLLTCSDIGVVNVTLTAFDECLNSSSCTVEVTVVDTIPPVLTCPGDMILHLGPDECDIVVWYDEPTATDNCEIGPGRAESVLIIGANNPAWNMEVRTGIMNNSSIATVDAIDGRLNTPTLAQLMQYDAVMVYSDARFQNATLLGNNLADYIDAGGGVVTAVFANASVPIGGRFASDNYWALQPAGQQQGTTMTLGTVHEPGSELMVGVTNYNGGTNSYHSTGTVHPMAVRVADYNNGDPLIVRREINGTKRADLNMYPPSNLSRGDFWVNTTDGWMMMINALNFVSGASILPPVVEQIDNTGFTNGDLFPIGETCLIYRATDSQGNTSTCQFCIQVENYPNEITTLQCNNNIRLSLDASCMIDLNADMILEGGPYGCADGYDVVVEDVQGNIQDLDNNPRNGTQLGAPHVGNCYKVTVIDPDNNNSCWGTICIEDKLPPVVVGCVNDTISCTQDSDPFCFGGDVPCPIAMDACDPFVASSYVDWTTDGSCDAGFEKIVSRRWTFTDNQGNSTTCVQEIYVTLSTLFDVALPGNYDDLNNPALLCDEKIDSAKNINAHILDFPFCVDGYLLDSAFWFATGGDPTIMNQDARDLSGNRRPRTLGWNCLAAGPYKGHPSPFGVFYEPHPQWELFGVCWGPNEIVQWTGTGIPTGASCSNIEYTYKDTRINLTDPDCNAGDVGCYKVLRQWTLIDWCTGEVGGHDQIIKVLDKEAPQVIAPDVLQVGTDVWKCEGVLRVPAPWLKDNCSDDLDYTVVIKTGTVTGNSTTGFSIVGLAIGEHTLYYEAFDCCGNTGVDSVILTVVDDTPPVCISEDRVQLSLAGSQSPGSNFSSVCAEDLNQASYDNCSPNVWFKTIRMEELLGTVNGSFADNTIACSGVNGDDDGIIQGNQVYFDDCAKFCCEDADEIRMVVLRVHDVNPGAGPVNPLRYTPPAGDLVGHFTDCWVEVDVRDKAQPIVVAPPDIVVSCMFWFDDSEDALSDINNATFGRVVTDLGNREKVKTIDVVCDEWCEDHPKYDYEPSRNRPAIWRQACDFYDLYYNPAHPDDKYELVWGFDGYAIRTCGAMPTIRVDDRRECGQGVINRDVIVSFQDPKTGGVVTFRDRQEIWVIDCDPFYATEDCFDDDDCIDWPLFCQQPDPIDGCGADLDPYTNPQLGFPTIVNGCDDNCALVAVEYEDEVFTVEPDACFKVIRTWTVIDWCTYDPLAPEVADGDNPDIISEGRYQFIQIIKVRDKIDPTITVDVGDCEPAVKDTADGICYGHIDICAVATDDCSPDDWLRYDYKIDAFSDGTGAFGHYDLYVGGLTLQQFNNGITLDKDSLRCVNYVQNSYCNPYADDPTQPFCASGSYPVGTHTIYWFAEDGCGNVIKDTTVFEVLDCKQPTPYCKPGIVTVVMPVNGQICVWAKDLDDGSFDNCTEQEDLKFYFNGDPNWVEYCINCDSFAAKGAADKLIVDVEVWVEDEEGNTDFCITTMEIQDNQNVCQDTGNIIISGVVESIMHQDMVEGVEISLNNGLASDMTTLFGEYAFVSLKGNRDYNLSAYRNDEPLNGVSTKDLVAMQRHLLGLAPFTSGFEMIAADVNNNTEVTASDISSLRKVILGSEADFSKWNDQTSWRFVDANEQIVDNVDPWPFNEQIDYTNVNSNIADANFNAVKIGDVTGDAVSSGLISNKTRSNDPLTLVAQDQSIEPGQEYRMDITAHNFDQIAGVQWTMRVNEMIEFQAIESAALTVGQYNIGLNNISQGLITLSWNDLTGQAVTVEDGDVLFTLVFDVLQPGKASEAINLTSDITRAEAYGNDLNDRGLNLEFRNGIDVVEIFELYQNNPNPFNETTKVGFNLPRNMEAIITIYDVAGQVILIKEIEAIKGYNEINVSKAQLNGAGVLYYQLDAEDFTQTKKMIVIE